MKQEIDKCNLVYTLWLLCIISIGIAFAFGCTTTKTTDGTTIKQVDKEAIAQGVAIALEIMHDPAVSNAIWHAQNK